MGQANGQVAIVEASHILDTFATELSGVERLGSCVRFTLTSIQHSPGGEYERVVVAKIVIPLDAVPAAIRLTLKELCLPTLEFMRPGNALIA